MPLPHQFLGVVFCCVLATPLVTLAGEARALLVGIDYRGSANQLDACEGDARSMGLTLIRQLGFDESNVQLLLGDQATRENIISGLRRLASESAAVDTVVFYYSGHGSRLADDNGDEEDGFDETICTYDIVSGVGPDDGQLRDDAIGSLLDQIPASRQIVILDSCHSGTGTRNLTRCAREKCLPPSGPTAWSKTPDRAQYLELRRKGREVLIAGCDATETSSVIRVPTESRQFSASALTFYLNQILRGAAAADGDGRITYRELVNRTQRGIDEYFQNRSVDEPTPAVLQIGPLGKRAAQTVQLETTSPDDFVFGGSRIRPFFTLLGEAIGGQVELDTGAIHGWRLGMVLTVFEAGGRPVGRIEIAELLAERALARVLTGDGSRGWKGCRATLEAVAIPTVPEPNEPVAPSQSTPVRLLTVRMVARGRGATEVLTRGLASALLRERFIRVVEQDEAPVDIAVLVSVAETAGVRRAELALQRRSGQVTDPLQATGANLDDLRAALLPQLIQRLTTVYAARVLAELCNPQPGFAVSMTCGRGSSRPTYRIGETFTVQVRTSKDCYLTIIDLATSGDVSVVYPPPGVQSVRVPAGQMVQLPHRGQFKVAGPPGIDRLKAIATVRPLSLQEINGAKGKVSASVLGELSRSMSSRLGTKASGSVVIPTHEWAEASLSIEIGR